MATPYYKAAKEAGAKLLSPVDALCDNNTCAVRSALCDASHYWDQYLLAQATFLDVVFE